MVILWLARYLLTCHNSAGQKRQYKSISSTTDENGVFISTVLASVFAVQEYAKTYPEEFSLFLQVRANVLDMSLLKMLEITHGY